MGMNTPPDETVATETRWKIRPMTISDYDSAFRLWLSTAGMRMTDADFRTGLAVLLEKQGRLSFVATCDGEIIATALCGDDGQTGYVNQIVVAAEHRKKGIEQALFDACLAEFTRAGLKDCRFGYGRANPVR